MGYVPAFSPGRTADWILHAGPVPDCENDLRDGSTSPLVHAPTGRVQAARENGRERECAEAQGHMSAAPIGF